MPELTDQDAMRIAREFYNKKFKPENTVEILSHLNGCDIVGLIQYVYNQCVIDTRGELNL